MPETHLSLEAPNVLSFLAFSDFNAFVPWMNDILYKGYTDHDWNYQRAYIERIDSWKIAIQALADYKQAKKDWNESLAAEKLKLFREYEKDFGFGYFSKDNMEAFIPNVYLLFYSFRVMVWAWTILPFIFLLILVFTYLDKIENRKWLLRLWILSFVMAFVASQLGWVVAEVGRQPWTVQNVLPTMMSTSHVDLWTVQFTFFMFLFIFTLLLIAEIKIMTKAIKDWPKIDEK